MANYTVKLKTAPKGHTIPPLLANLGAWVGKQKHGTLGWFDTLAAEAVPKEWDEEHADKLRKDAFVFLSLPDGSMLTLVNTGNKGAPPAVAFLDSEGDSRTIANSLEEFITLWSKGETSIDDLDDEEAGSARPALSKWIKDNKVKPPKTKTAFDFQAWLDGGGSSATNGGSPPAPPATAKRAPTEHMKKLGPKLKKLAGFMGMRADDPALVTYITKDLGKKPPLTTSDRSDDTNVVAPRAGIELAFSHNVLNDAYPPIHKTPKSYVPYLSYAWVREKIGENVMGLSWKADAKEAIETLGEPTSMERIIVTDKKPTVPTWTYLLDSGAGVELEISVRNGVSVTLALKSSVALEQFPDVSTGLFVAWAAENNLLDEARFTSPSSSSAALLADLKKRKIKGSDFLRQALPRGLWKDHLIDNADLRDKAYLWFHNMKSLWITADLKKLFGKREGKYGHDEPKVDEDTWDNVDKAAKVFQERFGDWVGKKTKTKKK